DQFTRMPFGLKNAPITFQKLMDEFLRGVDEDVCQVYMDDLLVFSKTEKQHIEDLKSVFNRIRKFGLKLSAEKSLLGKGEITFLGHTITKEGVKPDKSKIDAISRMAVPRDVKGIRRLLGSLNYYRRFVPEMAEYLVPINNLLKKGRKIFVTPEMENNFRKCMARLQEEPGYRDNTCYQEVAGGGENLIRNFGTWSVYVYYYIWHI
ncbi:reverse transcriptase domain-containing protein, partial [Klebsiella pneumoniae]|uniref:reverse transcriptase domain-containing protein n=1 Tax=Klebsiella pneumoniae TaxID=573 RepID=UPI00405577ED